jgi:hypothetical protein
MCIIVYQYNETNVMHFSFNLLRIKCLYMFEHYLLSLRRRAQTALGILLAYNVSWSATAN